MDPQVLRWLIDNYLTKPSEHAFDVYVRGLLMWLWWLISVAMISRLAKNFQDYFVNVMTQQIGTDIYQNTIAHTFSLPYAVFEDQQSGQLLQKLIKAKESIQMYIGSLIGIVFFSLVGITVVLGYSFIVDYRIGLLYLLLMPIVAITTFSLSSKIKTAQTNIAIQSNALSGSITESLRNVSLIKMLGLVSQEITRISGSNTKILDLELQKVKTVRTMEFIQGTLINGMRVTLIGFLWYLVYDGSITVWELMSLYFYSFFLFSQLSQFGQVTKNYQEAKANHDILQEIMLQQPEAVDTHLPKVDTITSIRMDTVSFGYSPEKEVIHQLSASWNSGQSIAFVGPSGSGKSTILKLLSWLYKPSQGTILINGKPTSEINMTAFKQQIWIVSQDTQLFSGTIRDNLLFVAPQSNENDLLTVLHQASLTTFISELPQGLNTMIGEGGIKLSWWQKQRLAIARALLRNPQILIFDEATSSLDSIVEKEITDTIHAISKSRPDLMTIIVAHRLSTVMHADMIYVLEHWTVSESGTHKELLDHYGLYQAMWRQQIGE